MEDKWPHITFPKVKPYEAEFEYRISKNFTKLPKLYPGVDVVRQNDPTTTLTVFQIKLHQTESLLRKKRKGLVDERVELDKQWKELCDKEFTLRENFELFDKFVRENADKKRRASKKIIEDGRLCEERSNDVENMKLKIELLRSAKVEMEAKIKEYTIYEKFLEEVLCETSEFHSATEIIESYYRLNHSKKTLGMMQEANMKTLENAKNDLMKLMENKSFIIMGLNNKIADLQARYEHAHLKSLDYEQLVLKIKNNTIQNMNEYDMVRTVIWNMFQLMIKAKKHPPNIKKQNVEQQMIYIKRVLTELRKINHVLRKTFLIPTSTSKMCAVTSNF